MNGRAINTLALLLAFVAFVVGAVVPVWVVPVAVPVVLVGGGALIEWWLL